MSEKKRASQASSLKELEKKVEILGNAITQNIATTNHLLELTNQLRLTLVEIDGFKEAYDKMIEKVELHHKAQELKAQKEAEKEDPGFDYGEE